MKNSEKFTPKFLRSKRKEQGLSIEDLGKLAMLQPKTIKDYEAGSRIPSRTAWSSICKVFHMTEEERAKVIAKRKEPKVDTWTTPSERFTPKVISFSFEMGRCYSIRDTPRTCGAKYDTEINPKSGNYCIFKYIGQSGIHHKFIEIKGGWTRTYTNQQLIGKVIEEAEHEQA